MNIKIMKTITELLLSCIPFMQVQMITGADVNLIKMQQKFVAWPHRYNGSIALELEVGFLRSIVIQTEVDAVVDTDVIVHIVVIKV